MPPERLTNNDRIHKSVDAIKSGTKFKVNSLIVIKGKWECSGRKIASILKSRIRGEHNPTGDLIYDKRTEMWEKL